MAERASRASQSAPRGSMAYRASRFQMMQEGIPEDYVDALLDEEYMERLIVATNHLNTARRTQLKRYYQMNNIIFIFLVCQSVVGVFVALYKTVLQPDQVFSSTTEIPDVQMVLMLDTSNHMASVRSLQQQAAISLTGMLNQTMVEKRQDTQKKALAQLQKLQDEGSHGLSRLFNGMLKWMTKKKSDEATVEGGSLRISTGVFNGKDTRILHKFTNQATEQETALSNLAVTSPDAYKIGVSRWGEAFEKCQQVHAQDYAALAEEMVGRPNMTRYCVIIGDDQAMCNKRGAENADLVKQMCEIMPDGCVSDEEMASVGNMLEFPEELQECTEQVAAMAQSQISLIMMFTVMNQGEGQLRLSNTAFKNFVEQTTGCQITRTDHEVVNTHGVSSLVSEYATGNNCERFFMGNGFEEVVNKSKKIADMLKAEDQTLGEPNKQKDYRFLVFLLLPLNLLFYVIWSKIVRCGTQLQTKTQRAMGAKKKMIKVTKTLVEKVARRDSMAVKFAAQLSEVEMAEVSSMRPPIEFGAQMTLRARLKGGYLRKGAASCDGGGTSMDKMANWIFEPVEHDDPNMAPGVQVGQRVRLKSPNGNCYVNVDSEGVVTFVPADTVGQARIESLEFMVEPANDNRHEEDPFCRLGDTVRVQSASTGKYVRVQKDGQCDGLGDHADPETQYVVDRGGPKVHSGSIITIRSLASGEFMHGTPDGAVQAKPGGQAWKYWLIERKGAVGSKSAASTTFASGHAHGHARGHGHDDGDGESTSATASLKVGDIVSLRGFNQFPLEADAKGRCICGKPPKTAGGLALDAIREDAAGGVPEPPPMEEPVVQEFIIERVGMGLVAKHDQSIRRGVEVCLRPYRKDAEGSDTASTYIKVNEDGKISADGRVTSNLISFIIEKASMSDVVSPLHNALSQGDVELLIAPLWNKADVKRFDALSSSWTQDENLMDFRGAVVVASEKGGYTVPKAKGDGWQGWVAVVNEGVDIYKAARQAKAQGATGLIIKCDEALSLERLSHGVDAGNPPDLPAVYVNKAVAEALNERGINLKGCEFKKKYITEVMRTIGRAGAAGQQGHNSNVVGDVFKAVGAAMIERHKEKANAPVEEERGVMMEDEDTSQGDYKWKVSSNTHYLWSSGGGGASKMDVNFGKKAPPSAGKDKVSSSGKEVRCDASADFNDSAASSSRRRRSTNVRRSVVGVALLDSDDLKEHRLAHQLSEVLTMEEAAEPLEQLSDESDFKIEYTFEEVEVALGEKREDLEEEDLMDDEGSVIRTLGVPVGRFWLVAGGLVVSTTVLCALLLYCLNYTPAPKDKAKRAKVVAAAASWAAQQFQFQAPSMVV